MGWVLTCLKADPASHKCPLADEVLGPSLSLPGALLGELQTRAGPFLGQFPDKASAFKALHRTEVEPGQVRPPIFGLGPLSMLGRHTLLALSVCQSWQGFGSRVTH